MIHFSPVSTGARYRVLKMMLDARVDMFITDLDVVLLADPTAWLRRGGDGGGVALAASHDLLIQSDARDGYSALEHDPALLQKRLRLRDTIAAPGWAYANGGIFYVRPTTGSFALFTMLARSLAAAASPPNEQDLLNAALAFGGVRWALLPPSLFPNGFVYFYRPIASLAAPLLVHANWINGAVEKEYHLAESGWWMPSRADAGSTRHTRLLSLADTSTATLLSFSVHWRALRDGLVLAAVLNRTLVLPSLPIASAVASPTARSLSHFFDYSHFAAAFPRHAPRTVRILRTLLFAAHVPWLFTARGHPWH